MAVTSSYHFTSLDELITTIVIGRVDLASRTDGGFAFAANYDDDDSSENLFDENGTWAGDYSVGGVHPSLAQLTTGHQLTATIFNGDVRFQVTEYDAYNFEVSYIVAPTLLSKTSCAAVDVAALAAGKFAMAYQRSASPGNRDVLLTLRNADGSDYFSTAVVATRADDMAPSIATLEDGGFAVAWHRQISGQSELWYVVYNANGTIRKAHALLDTFGSVNRNPSVCALDDGGFAIAYEDNGWSLQGDRDITLARFEADGTLLGQTDISGTSHNEFLPALTTLSNGLLAVSASDNAKGGVLKGILTLVDPTTGLKITSPAAYLDDTVDNAETAIARLSLGRLAVFASELDGNGEVEGTLMQAVRTTFGDAAHNNIKGDELVDKVFGIGGNDTVSAGANNDVLSGGGAKDFLLGGAGNDIINGDTGVDILVGGSGTDTLNGGADPDIFDYNAMADTGFLQGQFDRIVGFADLQDKIDLLSLDAQPGTPGDQAFSFIGTAQFSALGQVRVQDFGANTKVEINLAGSLGQDMAIFLTGIDETALSAADFVL